MPDPLEAFFGELSDQVSLPRTELLGYVDEDAYELIAATLPL